MNRDGPAAAFCAFAALVSYGVLVFTIGSEIGSHIRAAVILGGVFLAPIVVVNCVISMRSGNTVGAVLNSATLCGLLVLTVAAVAGLTTGLLGIVMIYGGLLLALLIGWASITVIRQGHAGSVSTR